METPKERDEKTPPAQVATRYAGNKKEETTEPHETQLSNSKEGRRQPTGKKHTFESAAQLDTKVTIDMCVPPPRLWQKPALKSTTVTAPARDR